MKSLIKITCFSILSFASLTGNSQGQGDIKLQCDGTYNNYLKANMRNISVKGMYIEMQGDSVKIMGAPGFNATYAVHKRFEHGIGITLKSNESFGGFINRLTGELSLQEKGKIAKDGSYQMKQLIQANCRNATALF